MSGDFQDEIECLGIEASPSFVREPQGNGVAERFIRTLKENLLWAPAHEVVDEKSNEIPAVQALIATLGLSGRVFTLDAMHCQKNLRDRPRHRQ